MKQSIKRTLSFTMLIFIYLTAVGANLSILNQRSYKVRKIMIDPGFGGEESGPRSSCSNGNDSKDINLTISLKLEKLIKERLAIDVALTRDADRTVSLDDRTALANNSNCDLFISIHCNAHENSRIYGIETSFVSNQRECKRLNSIEYQKDLCEGIVKGLEKYIENINNKDIDSTQQH